MAAGFLVTLEDDTGAYWPVSLKDRGVYKTDRGKNEADRVKRKLAAKPFTLAEAMAELNVKFPGLNGHGSRIVVGVRTFAFTPSGKPETRA